MAFIVKIILLISVIVVAKAQEESIVRFCCIWEKFCASNDTILLQKLEGQKGFDELSSGVEVLKGDPCRTRINGQSQRHKDAWGFKPDGSIWKENISHPFYKLEDKASYNTSEYCIESVEDRLYLLSCDAGSLIDFDTDEIYMILSLVCLIITFVVYAFLKELRSRQDKCVMSFTFSLACYYFMVYATHTFWEPREIGCFISYYVFTFLFYTNILWIHAMSFDIWRAVRSIENKNFSKSNKMRKFYLYTFGLPTILTGFMFTIDFNSSFLPHLRFLYPLTCWIEVNVIGQFINRFVGDFVLICNIFFFCASAWAIYKVHRQISQMKDLDARKSESYKELKVRFYMNLRLVLMMEISESIEFLAGFFGPTIFYKAINVFNKLQGVVIFILFICTPKVIKLLAAKLSKVKRLKTTETS